jgi:bacillithiol system protein YtxJ
MYMDAIRTLTDESVLQEALTSVQAVIYKHSPSCGISWRALQQIRKFTDQKPETPVFMVDVISQHALSSQIARQLGIRHESPQAIVLRNGQPIWHGSHFKITVGTLEEQTSAA